MKRRQTRQTLVAAAATDADLLMTAGGRFGRDTVVYGIAMGMALPFGLAGVAIFTRYLTPAEYGHLALLLVFSAMLTVLYNLPTLLGTFAVAYGATADEDIDVENKAGFPADRAGEALATGLVLTLLTVAPPAVVLVLLAPEIAELIAGPELTSAVRWAALSAAAGSIFRLVLNIPRMEHRPVLYSSLSTLRPAFALVIGTVLVAQGSGPEGVVAGLAIGTSLASVITLIVTARSYARRVSFELASAITQSSRRLAPMIVSIWTLQNVDLLLLSRYASDAAVGSYRVANRLAAFVLYGVSAYLMAMGPVQQSSLFKAAHDTVGQVHVNGLLTRYFAIGGVYIVLVVALAADVLFLLAPPAYREAAPLVPLIAAGFLAFGFARVLGRTAPVSRRGPKTILSMSVTALCFLPLCFALIVLAGEFGAASAMLVAMIGTCAWWATSIAKADERLEVGWRHVLTAGLVAAACYALVVVAGPLAGGWRVVTDAVIAVLVCPALFVLTGAIPLRHVKPIVAASVLPRRRTDLALKDRLDQLDGSDLAQIHKGLVISRSRNARLMARPTDLERFVGVLREVGHLGEGQVHDGYVGVHLVSGGTYAEAQARAEALRARGVDPTELYRLEEVFERADRLLRVP